MKTPIATLTVLLTACGFLHGGEKTTTAELSTTKPAADRDATLFPIPNFTGSFWERERLLGDLGGPRQTLAEHGIQIDFNMTHTYQGVFSGGESQGWSQRVSDLLADVLQNQLTRGLIRLEDSNTVFSRVLTQPIRRRGDITLGQVLQGRIDRLDFGGVPPTHLRDSDYQGTWRLELKLDTAKMSLWPGGFVFLRAEQNYGRDINARSGAVIPPNVNSTLPLPGLDGVTIPHLTITQFLSEHLALSVGKLDPTGGDSNEFAHIIGDDRFLGSAFACNPVVALTAPYSALGAALLILPTKDFVLALSAIDTEGIATRTGFDTVWERRTTYLAEGRLTTHFGGKVGHQLLGLIYASGEFGEFEQPLRAFIPGSGVSPSRADETWAIYYNFDQYLWNPEGDPTRGVGIFGRVGVADESTSAIAQF